VVIKAWCSESDVLAGHLIENEQRSDLTFWDKAQGVVALKAALYAYTLDPVLRRFAESYPTTRSFDVTKLAQQGELALAQTLQIAVPPRAARRCPTAVSLGVQEAPQDPPNSNGAIRQPWLALPCATTRRLDLLRLEAYKRGKGSQPPAARHYGTCPMSGRAVTIPPPCRLLHTQPRVFEMAIRRRPRRAIQLRGRGPGGQRVRPQAHDRSVVVQQGSLVREGLLPAGHQGRVRSGASIAAPRSTSSASPPSASSSAR